LYCLITSQNSSWSVLQKRNVGLGGKSGMGEWLVGVDNFELRGLEWLSIDYVGVLRVGKLTQSDRLVIFCSYFFFQIWSFKSLFSEFHEETKQYSPIEMYVDYFVADSGHFFRLFCDRLGVYTIRRERKARKCGSTKTGSERENDKKTQRKLKKISTVLIFTSFLFWQSDSISSQHIIRFTELRNLCDTRGR